MSITRVTRDWTFRKAGLGGANNQQALEQLTRHVPVEAIALFVATMSIATALLPQPADSAWRHITLWHVYGAFVTVVTPALVIGLALRSHSLLPARQPGEPAVAFSFPTTPLILAVVAFAAWGLSVPGLVTTDNGKILAPFAASAVSVFLSIIEPILRRYL